MSRRPDIPRNLNLSTLSRWPLQDRVISNYLPTIYRLTANIEIKNDYELIGLHFTSPYPWLSPVLSPLPHLYSVYSEYPHRKPYFCVVFLIDNSSNRVPRFEDAPLCVGNYFRSFPTILSTSVLSYALCFRPLPSKVMFSDFSGVVPSWKITNVY